MPLTAQPGVVVVADDDEYRALAVAAVEQTGGRLMTTTGWHGAAEVVADYGSVRVVMAETRDVPDECLETEIERIATAARSVGAKFVVSLDQCQIDIVAGQLIDGETWLLCEPSMDDRIAAAAVSMHRPAVARLNDASRDAARLDRLDEDVARIAEALARLARQAAPLPPNPLAGLVGDRRSDFVPPPATVPDGAVDAAEVRRTIRARRMRTEAFGIEGLFEDPAWDILLDLFAARLEHRQVSVSSLCIAAAVAPTTALRWITKLIDAGLLDRRPDSFDRRRAFIVLTDRAATAMTAHVAALKRAGLPLV